MFAANMLVNEYCLGQEGQPLVVVDNFFSLAQQLVDSAPNRPFTDQKAYYPGVRSVAPKQYLMAVHAITQQTLAGVFGFSIGDLVSINSAYSYVTKKPDQLSVLQRIPHFDLPRFDGIACVHYLFPDATFGGTSFYRHRNTGFEYVNETRLGNYKKILDDEVNSVGLPEPAQYINGDTELFTRHHSCEAKFNRAIFYRACMLHSGDIYVDHKYNSPVLDNRLTMTTFIKVEPHKA